MTTGLRERKKQTTRQLLESVALRLFEEQGYEGTTVEQQVDLGEARVPWPIRLLIRFIMVFGREVETPPLARLKKVVEEGGGVKFVGSTNVLENQYDENSTLSFMVDGDGVFGALSTRVQGTVDLSPAMSLTTRLADLKGANGDGVHLATVIHDVLALTKTPAAGPVGNANADLGFDPKQVDSTIGHAGKNNNGIYQFSIPRAEKIMENGMAVPNSMGIATALNFQPTGNGKAANTGDFCSHRKGSEPGNQSA